MGKNCCFCCWSSIPRIFEMIMISMKLVAPSIVDRLNTDLED